MRSTLNGRDSKQSESITGIPDWGIGPFVKQDGVNPILSPRDSVFDCPMRGEPVRWELGYVFNPAAIVRNGEVNLLYRAEDGLGDKLGGHTSRLGRATSSDGTHFRREDAPVLFPRDDDQKQYDWPGGCEDPRLVEREDGTYVVLYSAWNHENVHLSAATSTDLVNWTKHGPVLAKAHGGRFHHTWTKAGAIVTELVEGRLIAAKIDGRYWMYFGEGDVYVATSDDLIDWNPLLDGDGNLLAMFSTRDGKFDSTLCEPGPPALLTEDGIVLLYNGRNDEVVGDPSLPAGIYCAGQALFDSHSPDRLVARTTEPWFKPSSGYETTGQYVQGTVFIEGLVYFEDRWFLYYGTADSHVAVAIWDPSYSESHQKTKPDRSESKK